jgi:UDP-3-O-[3-hydroxymyristoyl] glucosamine N-acyltransferase
MKTFTLAELAKITESELIGDPGVVISNVDTLEAATERDASFLANLRYRELLAKTKAGVICIDASVEPLEGKNFLISDNASRTFQQIIELVLDLSLAPASEEGIHPTAVLHPSVKIGAHVVIGPYVVIEQGVEIGDKTRIGPFVSIGSGVKIGRECLFHPHVVIRERCVVGNRVIFQPGVVVGSCGFGYTTDARGVHTKLDQLGIVVIEDDVEIGANTTIDRARFKETRVSCGTKIDNLVQVGHNVVLGPHNILVSQSGIAGSSKTGRNVVLGGQVGVIGHLELTDGVMIASRGGVSKSLTKTGKYSGAPALPLAEHNRQQVYLRKIETYVKRIEELEKRLKELEETIAPPISS